jgi:V/A-type H+-transporting ATPase subunit E
MATELQELLLKVRDEGVRRGEEDAARIAETARAQAAELLAKARREAEALRASAEADARAFEESGARALRQAARDVTLTLRESLQATIERLAGECARAAFDPEAVRRLLPAAVEAYLKGGASGVEAVLAAGDAAAAREAVLARLGQEMARGVEVRAGRGAGAGFTIRLNGGAVEHDFTDTALREALASLLRPRLAAILRDPGEAASGRQ